MTINEDSEVLYRGEESFGSGDEKFCFVTVEFEKVIVHPGFYVGEAV